MEVLNTNITARLLHKGLIPQLPSLDTEVSFVLGAQFSILIKAQWGTGQSVVLSHSKENSLTLSVSNNNAILRLTGIMTKVLNFSIPTDSNVLVISRLNSKFTVFIDGAVVATIDHEYTEPMEVSQVFSGDKTFMYKHLRILSKGITTTGELSNPSFKLSKIPYLSNTEVVYEFGLDSLHYDMWIDRRSMNKLSSKVMMVASFKSDSIEHASFAGKNPYYVYNPKIGNFLQMNKGAIECTLVTKALLECPQRPVILNPGSLSTDLNLSRGSASVSIQVIKGAATLGPLFTLNGEDFSSYADDVMVEGVNFVTISMGAMVFTYVNGALVHSEPNPHDGVPVEPVTLRLGYGMVTLVRVHNLPLTVDDHLYDLNGGQPRELESSNTPAYEWSQLGVSRTTWKGENYLTDEDIFFQADDAVECLKTLMVKGIGKSITTLV